MSTIISNASRVSNKTQNNPSYTKSLDTGTIVGLAIGCFAVVIIVIGVCCYFSRKYQYRARTLRRKKKKEETSPTAATVPAFSSIPPIITHDIVPKESSIAKPVKPKVIPEKPHPRSSLHLHGEKPRETIVKLSKPDKSNQCIKDICKQYSINLGMNKVYFNFDHNRCYCAQCYPSTKTDRFTVANSIYTVPRGWTRFGLQIDRPFAESKQIFKQWYTTFYGTSKDKLESIVNNRFIPIPGDRLLSGELFTTHLPDKHHVYTSPSINYACLRHVCPNDTVKINNEWYDVQTVLECKQNPNGIVKQQGCRPNICRIISDGEIEWKTNQRSSIVPSGVLFRARKHQCTRKCTNAHS